MKLLVTTDFHGSMDASRKTVLKAKNVGADVIIICGDITHFGSVEDAKELMQPLIALRLPVFYVPGNCDPPQLARAKIKDAICLHGECQSQGDVSFLGLGGAPTSQFYSLFEMTETEIMKTLNESVKRCSQGKWFVVVSHSAPIDTRVDLAFSNVHAGSISLRKFIEQRKPHIVFCGHIHEARGIDHIGKTVLVNPGPVRHGNLALVDLDNKIEVRLESM